MWGKVLPTFSSTPEPRMASPARTALDEIKAGEFRRTEAGFRSWIREGDPRFPPEGALCPPPRGGARWLTANTPDAPLPSNS